jgi:predicted dehydrogenase
VGYFAKETEMIGVGIIGAGFMGRNHFNQYEKMKDRCQVVALCDKEADRRVGDWSNVGGNVADSKGTKRDLGSVKPYVDWREMLADPKVQAVDICVPTPLHREMAVGCLQAGKHVLCEKPMALNTADCDAMLAAAKESKGKLMVAQVIRFWPEYVYLKGLIESGEYGQLKCLHLRRQAAMPDYTLGNWALKPEMSGGALLDLHIHDVDYALYVLGKPKAVYAQGYPRKGGAVDRVYASWDYGDDRVVQVEGSWDMQPGWAFNMGFTAIFEKAAVWFEMNTGKPLTVIQGKESHTPTLLTDDGYYREIEYFLGCVQKNEAPKITTPQQSREAVEMALLEKQSLSSGQVVAVR